MRALEAGVVRRSVAFAAVVVALIVTTATCTGDLTTAASAGTLTVDAPSVALSVMAGDSASQGFSVVPPATDIQWTTTSNAGWLLLSPASGTGSGTVQVTVQTANLAPGTYTAAIAVTATGGVSVPPPIPVSLTVTPRPTCAVNVTGVTGGTVTGGGSYPCGSPVTVSAAPATGYAFVQWMSPTATIVYSRSASYSLVASTPSVDLQAIFVRPAVITTASSPANGGATSGGVTLAEYPATDSARTMVTVTATPNAGFTFVNWTEGGVIASTASSYAFQTSVSRNLVANFAAVAVPAAIAPVATVAVSLPKAVIAPGERMTAVATLRDSVGQVLGGRAVSWSVTPLGVATVSDSGVITGVAQADAIVSATSEGKTGVAAFSVTPPPVASLTISLSSPTIGVGHSVRAMAIPMDQSGKRLLDQAVSITTSSPTTATINQSPSTASAIVNAVAVGTAQITAAVEGLSTAAPLTVMALPVSVVTISLQQSSIRAGQTTQATATLQDSGGVQLSGRSVVWGSSNPAVASVSATGLVTAIATGTTLITASSEGISSTSVQLTVSANPVASVTVNLPASLLTGQTVAGTTTLQDATGATLVGRTVRWVSLSPQVATVDSVTGVITGVSQGTVSIGATSEGQWGYGSLSVVLPFGSITIAVPGTNIAIGQNFAATAQVRDPSGALITTTVAWSSSNTAVLSVTPNGFLAGVTVGVANLIATYQGHTTTVPITVVSGSPRVARVTVTVGAASLGVGESTSASRQTFDANGNVAQGSAPVWSSSNSSVATVGPSTGAIVAVGAGSAVITATVDGISGSANLTVTAALHAKSVVVTFPDTGVQVGKAIQGSATAVTAAGTTIPGRSFVWFTGPGSVTVDPSTGVVTGVANGYSFVQATDTIDHVLGYARIAVFTVTAGAPTQMQFVAGSGQTANPGAVLPIAPAVRVQDAFGTPTVGTSVTFAVVGGGGTVTGASAVTDATGTATVGSWQLGLNLGTNTLRAFAAGPPYAYLTATAQQPEPWVFGISTNAVNGLVGDTLIINAGAESSNTLTSVVATLGSATYALQGTSPNYSGTFNIAGAPFGPLTLSITATDSHGATWTSSTSISHDRKPVLTVSQPAEGATVNGSVRIVGSCIDDSGTCAMQVVTGNPFVTQQSYGLGNNSGDLTIDLQSYGTSHTQVTLSITGTDSSGQTVQVIRHVFVDPPM